LGQFLRILAPYSPDLNPLNFYACGAVEGYNDQQPHDTNESLKANIRVVMANMDQEVVSRAFSKFCVRIEKILEADGGFIEGI